MQIVTAGDRFTDIDAYGSAIAYAELLNLQGIPAKAILAGELNASIPLSVREWPVKYEEKYQPSDDDSFVLVDISDPNYLANFVEHKRIEEIIDHHPGYESYWAERGVKAQIELIGAACTQIYERWVKAGLFEQMSKTSAGLLATGILDNTLNFNASVTQQRDREAYKALTHHAGLPDDWPAQHFSQCQRSIEDDIEQAFYNDKKTLKLAGFEREIEVSQLVVWNAQSVLSNATELRFLMQEFSDWFINVVSIEEGSSYILADNEYIQEFLSRVINAVFIDGIARTDRLWLRKEIMKTAIDKQEELYDRS